MMLTHEKKSRLLDAPAGLVEPHETLSARNMTRI
jgi:hypothetical protein